MRAFKFVCILLFSTLLVTAEYSAQQSDAEPEEELQAAEIETPADAVPDTDLILADLDEDAADGELSNRRFIPTEEISQDLGVSFPVDI